MWKGEGPHRSVSNYGYSFCLVSFGFLFKLPEKPADASHVPERLSRGKDGAGGLAQGERPRGGQLGPVGWGCAVHLFRRCPFSVCVRMFSTICLFSRFGGGIFSFRSFPCLLLAEWGELAAFQG